ncbi:hypothetical protein [Calidithermus chliarophilus]|uniref:hypothetical protein n=1 Tax=Calidithermus chliarophilus TaxID=52023 RepID=UPI000481F9CC|nr:hypothetical protein [Calidithermus chliarophilus]
MAKEAKEAKEKIKDPAPAPTPAPAEPERAVSLEEWARRAGLDKLALAAMRARHKDPTERRTPAEWMLSYERLLRSSV